MENVSSFLNHCCGCGLCEKECPCHAISMEDDDRGFLFPSVDKKLCINCGKCVEKCSYNNTRIEICSQDVFLAKSKDEDIRKMSRSGGVFTAISDEIIKNHGIVYGCLLNDDFNSIHSRASTYSERDRFRGSKYLQSDITEIFDQIRKDLIEGKRVLFSGTPCQVSAIKTYCNNVSTENLLLIDIVCFGVPGKTIWHKYLRYLEKKNQSKLDNVNFRDKERYGWANQIESYRFKNGTICISNIYSLLYSKLYILRESCFSCPFKTISRVGDITMADAWGINDKYREFNDDKGTSLVLVNSKKGKEFFEKIKDDIIYYYLDSLDGFMQPCLQYNWNMPKDYREFWNDSEKLCFEKLISKYLKDTPMYESIPTRTYKIIIGKIKKKLISKYSLITRGDSL